VLAKPLTLKHLVATVAAHLPPARAA
jgi:hypothetical protein